MKIASIDIGTNAIKSKIFKTTPASIDHLFMELDRHEL